MPINLVQEHEDERVSQATVFNRMQQLMSSSPVPSISTELLVMADGELNRAFKSFLLDVAVDKSPKTSASQNLSGEPFFQQSDRLWRKAVVDARTWPSLVAAGRQCQRCSVSSTYSAGTASSRFGGNVN
jgi:hypothetical protein